MWSELYTQKNLGDILLSTLNGNPAIENNKYNLFGDPTIVLKYSPFADIVSNPENLPKEFSLAQNYPNPFNPSTKIAYSIPENLIGEQNVKLSIFNILGQEIEVLVNAVQSAGNYEVEFNASHLSSGTYLYQLKSGSFVMTSKMLLLK
ncbi:MAG: T9SS type A sorting domain-containing protein [Bacteroidetes bacterium]|nr:T9SS type A sorting domain-containing protein [Bacteroidota bacterium]MBU1113791.1 T9SS type A sorting domain-containing protein [Bacteroidota bacterium]MBU1798287.1 T9SS type A sorting domain-containing protein [Bacteroidota bacterium]